MVAAKAGDVWAKPVLVAGRACSVPVEVEWSVKARDEGIPRVDITVTASVASVGRVCRLGGFDSITMFSRYGLLWFLGSAV